MGSPEEIALVAVTSSAFGAIVTLIVTGWREGRRKKEAGKFAALFLADALEKYARTCAELLEDVRNFHGSNGQIGERHVNVPELPPYPSIDWNALGLKDAEWAMAFRAGVEETRAELAFLWQVDDDDSVEGDAERHAGAKGRQALTFAADLRKRRCLTTIESKWYAKRLAEAVGSAPT
jgi:hypothetical protein